MRQSMLPKQNIITRRARAAWKYVPTDELAGHAIGLHLIERPVRHRVCAGCAGGGSFVDDVSVVVLEWLG